MELNKVLIENNTSLIELRTLAGIKSEDKSPLVIKS